VKTRGGGMRAEEGMGAGIISKLTKEGTEEHRER